MNATTGLGDSTPNTVSSHCRTTSFKVLGVVVLAALATFGVLGFLQTRGHLPHAFSWLDPGLGQVGNQAVFGTMLAAAVVLPLCAFGVIQACKAKQDAREDQRESLERMLQALTASANKYKSTMEDQRESLERMLQALTASANKYKSTMTIKEQDAAARAEPIEASVQEELNTQDEVAKAALRPGEMYKDSHKDWWIRKGDQVRKAKDVMKELERML